MRQAIVLSQPTLAGALEEEIARLRGDVEALQRELRTVQLVKNNGKGIGAEEHVVTWPTANAQEGGWGTSDGQK